MWAAAVPANYDRKLGALIEDIYGDHQLMVRRSAFFCLISVTSAATDV